MNLLQRINEVRKAISYVQKDKSVSTGGGSYKAVTHDVVTAMVRPAMIEHGIVCFPSLVDSESKPKDEGAKQFRYEATYDFTFVNVEDDKDFLIIRIQAHAMDNADKAPGKALSYAKKYAVLKLFEIESGEDEESRFADDGMNEEARDNYLEQIQSAETMDELKAVFAVAYRAAGKDKVSQKVITNIYNIQKTELGKEKAK